MQVIVISLVTNAETTWRLSGKFGANDDYD